MGVKDGSPGLPAEQIITRCCSVDPLVGERLANVTWKLSGIGFRLTPGRRLKVLNGFANMKNVLFEHRMMGVY
jgi:hypothetical protein